MSLTSYRAAPPRVGGGRKTEHGGLCSEIWRPHPERVFVRRKRWLQGNESGYLSSVFCFPSSDLRRPGGDLLSRALRHSTMGAGEFHGRVRDGIGCLTPRHNHQVVGTEEHEVRLYSLGPGLGSRGSGRCMRRRSWIKPNERLVPVSFTHCCASTPGLSTWWSSTALQGELVLRGASRLDAFSGYPVRT